MQTSDWPLGKPGVPEPTQEVGREPSIEVGSQLTYQDQIQSYEEWGVGRYSPPGPVEVLVIIPKDKCVGVERFICKRLDSDRGIRLASMAEWVRDAGIEAGLDPEDKIVSATKRDFLEFIGFG